MKFGGGNLGMDGLMIGHGFENLGGGQHANGHGRGENLGSGGSSVGWGSGNKISVPPKPKLVNNRTNTSHQR